MTTLTLIGTEREIEIATKEFITWETKAVRAIGKGKGKTANYDTESMYNSIISTSGIQAYKLINMLKNERLANIHFENGISFQDQLTTDKVR